MTDWMTIGSLALGCVVALYVGRRVFATRSSYPLPPGPPGLPWVGTIVGIDPNAPWKTYAALTKTYGDVVYARLYGKDIIIINSEKVAKDLLDNRSTNYSDRPYLALAKMCELDFHAGLLPYGDRWRLHRRFLHQALRPEALSKFISVHHRKACHLLQRLFDTPDRLEDHVFEYAASVPLNSTYDYDPASRKDEFVDIMANVLKIVMPAMRPDIALMIGAFPLVFLLPSWFPGMAVKRQIQIARAYTRKFLELPFEYTLRRMPNGSVAPSMVHDILQDVQDKGTSTGESWMQALKEASATAFVGAAPTTNSALLTFFLMMVSNPAAQEKAQAQIDAVVGMDRLPTIDDRPLLPFIDAIFREVLRYNPILPLALPHASVDDDVYGGFFIPKGAILLPNLWSMTRNESKYPDPETFKPERFINDDGSLKPNDTEHIVFGFGRRICVGKHFADASLWAAMAKVLAVFKILKPLDNNGVEIQVEPKFTSGLWTQPLPFGCRIVPRFPGMNAKKLEQLIAASTA